MLDAKNYTSKRDGYGLGDVELVDALSLGNVENTSNLSGVKSDQLVIQYKNMMEDQFDCEGAKIPVNTFVVTKVFYFVKTR